jgi:hypothetical protein
LQVDGEDVASDPESYGWSEFIEVRMSTADAPFVRILGHAEGEIVARRVGGQPTGMP